MGGKVAAAWIVCPHCGEEVKKLRDERAWDLYGILSAERYQTWWQLTSALAIQRSELGKVIRHYRDHLVAQTQLYLICDDEYDYSLSEHWQSDTDSDIHQWDGGMLRHAETRLGHVKDSLLLAEQKIDGRRRKLKAEVRDVRQVVEHLADRMTNLREKAFMTDEEELTPSPNGTP